MSAAKPGDRVKAHYTGKLADGTTFDSSEGRDPLEFTLGAGQVIAGFEEAVLGMEPGQSKTHVIPPERGYGPRREELMGQMPLDRFPPQSPPKPGMTFEARTPSGQPAILRVVEVDGPNVTIDANHPLAGQELRFDIRLVEIVD